MGGGGKVKKEFYRLKLYILKNLILCLCIRCLAHLVLSLILEGRTYYFLFNGKKKLRLESLSNLTVTDKKFSSKNFSLHQYSPQKLKAVATHPHHPEKYSFHASFTFQKRLKNVTSPHGIFSDGLLLSNF